MKVRPNDKDARMKYQECNKIVKQKAFERAIASDEIKKSVVDSLDIENMSKCYFILFKKKKKNPPLFLCFSFVPIKKKI